MKKLIVLVAVLFAVSGCLDQRQLQSHFERRFVYFKDSRTNLCFAAGDANASVIVNVPCSELVMKQIEGCKYECH